MLAEPRVSELPTCELITCSHQSFLSGCYICITDKIWTLHSWAIVISHLPSASSFSRYVQLQNMKLAFIPDSSAKQCPYSYAGKKIQYVNYRLFWILADIKFKKCASPHASITFCLCTHCVLLLLESSSNLLIISAVNNLCILLELWWKAHWINHCCSCQPPS
jgi:hypothetical protein